MVLNANFVRLSIRFVRLKSKSLGFFQLVSTRSFFRYVKPVEKAEPMEITNTANLRQNIGFMLVPVIELYI